MPELPEVEVTRRALQAELPGSRITGCRLGKALRWPLGCDPTLLVGQRIGAIARRGKYLLLKLDTGELIVHLGMSGSLRWRVDLAGADGHEHWVLDTDRGPLRLRDPRRFGAVVWHGADAPPHPLLAALGPEPLEADFDGSVLHRNLRGRRAAIKTLLLDQKILVGVGNIYACEALFRAGIDPRLPGQDLSRRRCEALAAQLRATLTEAIAAGGSSLRDFHSTDGSAGHFQNATWVYGREAQPCKVCSTPIRLLTQGQRSTYYCPRCQRR